MPKKITKLTEAQERRLIDFREEWLNIGLCCEPADFETGDTVIRGFYARMGKPAPLILHFSSPAMCELAVNFVFTLLAQNPSQLYGQLGSQLDSQLVSQLYSQLDKLRPFFLTNRWGAQHWCSWEAFYLFGPEIGVTYKAEDIALLQEWARISRSTGWWAPWDGICFVSDRPRVVKFDNERRLHCETGKAVEYSDGWGVSSWHGTRVPDEWLADKKSLTAQVALKEQNIEQRRAACEILGWSRILKELDAKTIDHDNDPQIGDLVEVALPDLPQRAKFLRVQCGTGREFAIGIPPHIESSLEAQAWIVGLDTKDFLKPEVRT